MMRTERAAGGNMHRGEMLEFRGYDERIAKLHILSTTLGPVFAWKRAGKEIVTALYFSMPEAYWLFKEYGEAAVEDAVEAVAHGFPLTEKEKKILAVAEKLLLPDYITGEMLALDREVRDAWDRVKEAYFEITGQVYSEFPEKILIYVGPAITGEGGTAYRTTVVVTREIGSRWDITESLVHETLHILNSSDAGWKGFLADLKEQTGLPVEEALTNTLEQVIMWKAGTKGKMFTHYYKEDWPALVELEERCREAVTEWLEKGGDLKDLLRGALTRSAP